MRTREQRLLQALASRALLALAACSAVQNMPDLQAAQTTVTLNGRPLPPAHATAAGVWFYAEGERGNAGPETLNAQRSTSNDQVLLTGHGSVPESWRLTASLRKDEEVRLIFAPGAAPGEIGFKAETLAGQPLTCQAASNTVVIRAASGAGAIRLTRFVCGDRPLAIVPERRPLTHDPVGCSPDPLPAVAEALIEWDWRMQDGIGTPREPRTYAQAFDRLIKNMEAGSIAPVALAELRARRLPDDAPDAEWEDLWLAAHRLRREQMLSDPRFPKTPLLFVKHVPSVMSHQLTQMYGYCARPGGGLFILKEPGVTMRTRNLTPDSLPAGNFTTPELSFDAQRVLFAYCPVKKMPPKWDFTADNRHLRYHIYELQMADGSFRPLTQGDTDNFFPVYLSSGDILFSSTMRGGYHRCGSGPCFVYTLSRMGANGEHPRSISFHETHEWNPVLLPDGRVLYTRWDYVDRNAVLYQHLWTARPDGGNVRIYYGNNTWNPAGIWEARPVPGTHRVMATAAPHHGMTAGSIVLVDTLKGVDGSEPLRRLTPDTRFPESETRLAHGAGRPLPADFDAPVTRHWHSPLQETWSQQKPTEEEMRWPGHCYKSPWPLDETLFFASYSFDQLIGEPGANIPNMFGIYLCDAFGNKELLFRDPNISSVWARPVAKRAPPPEIMSLIDPERRNKGTGTFFLSNVMESWPYLPTNRPITALRLFEVLMKTTPNIDAPKVAAGLGAPGRQVLGSVPVEQDGSAYFEAPAGTPLYLQALDEKGRAVQTMRSLIYLQPGEMESCIGCHEHRMAKTQPRAHAHAIRRKPSKITPGPEGSKPFSYPRLVQPILDKHCVSCHDGKVPKRPNLTGAPEGWASRSFNALIKHVAYSSWNAPNQNYEPLTEPLRFGALGSPLLKLLESGHGKVKLTPDEWERLNTWMDANGAFYGTFDVQKQKKQLQGEDIGTILNTPDGLATDAKGHVYLSAVNGVDGTYPGHIWRMDAASGQWSVFTPCKPHPSRTREMAETGRHRLVYRLQSAWPAPAG